MPSDDPFANAFAHIDLQFEQVLKKIDHLQQSVEAIKKQLNEIQREGLPRGR